MPRRTRSFLIDNSFGKIFTGVSTTTEGGADKLLAGTKLLTKTITQNQRFYVIPTLNVGNGQGLILSAGESLLTQIRLSTSIAPAGQGVSITVLKGESFTTATTLGTYEIPALSKTASYNVSHQILSGERIFVNILTSGTTRKASGLSLSFLYYGA